MANHINRRTRIRTCAVLAASIASITASWAQETDTAKARRRQSGHRAWQYHRHGAEPYAGNAIGADPAADRHRQADRYAGRDGSEQDEPVRTGSGRGRRPAYPAPLPVARCQYRRLRHRYRACRGCVRGRRVCRAFGWRAAGLQRHQADRGAEGPAGHPVRPQCRGRRDLDHYQRTQRPVRRSRPRSLRRLRPALLPMRCSIFPPARTWLSVFRCWTTSPTAG